MINKAREFALKHHNGQLYGTEPYINHLDDVFDIAKRYNLDECIQTASYLHDLFEDTDVSFEDIWREFGWKVAILVYYVTDEHGSNRKERKIRTYEKTASNKEAILLKLCDRIANVQHSKNTNRELFNMYKKEQPDFIDGLMIGGTRYGILGEMISELNNLFE